MNPLAIKFADLALTYAINWMLKSPVANAMILQARQENREITSAEFLALKADYDALAAQTDAMLDEAATRT